MTFMELIQFYGLGILSVLVFAVTIIIEVTKNISFFKKIPTDAYTLILSVLLTTVAYFVINGVLNTTLIWYELVLSIFAGFPVAYIAMFGWEKLSELWNRFKK